MKIIDIAICTDNMDPKGLNRIRVIRYSEYNVGEKDQIKCFNYSNMQPMFKIDNLKKQATNKNKVFYSSSKFFYENKKQLLDNNEIIIYEK